MRRSFDSLRIFYCMIATGDHYIQIRLRYAQDDSGVHYLYCTTVGRGLAPAANPQRIKTAGASPRPTGNDDYPGKKRRTLYIQLVRRRGHDRALRI